MNSLQIPASTLNYYPDRIRTVFPKWRLHLPLTSQVLSQSKHDQLHNSGFSKNPAITDKFVLSLNIFFIYTVRHFQQFSYSLKINHDCFELRVMSSHNLKHRWHLRTSGEPVLMCKHSHHPRKCHSHPHFLPYKHSFISIIQGSKGYSPALLPTFAHKKSIWGTSAFIAQLIHSLKNK